MAGFKALFHSQKDSPKFQEFLKTNDISYFDIYTCTKFKKFDELYNRRVQQCSNLDEYYQEYSGNYHMDDIVAPLLMINSRRDMLVDWRSINTGIIEERECLFQILVNNGAHVKFPHGLSMKNVSIAPLLKLNILIYLVVSHVRRKLFKYHQRDDGEGSKTRC